MTTCDRVCALCCDKMSIVVHVDEQSRLVMFVVKIKCLKAFIKMATCRTRLLCTA